MSEPVRLLDGRVADEAPVPAAGVVDFLLTNSGIPPVACRPGTRWKTAMSVGGWSLFVATKPTGGGPQLVQRKEGRGVVTHSFGVVVRYRDTSLRGGSPLATLFAEIEAGCAAPEKLFGRFVIVTWDAASRSWRIWTDRLGSMHVYACQAGGGLAIGTHFRSVARASRRALDWEGLASFFATGFFVGDRTWFSDVRVVRPSMEMLVGESGISERRYWNWSQLRLNVRSYSEGLEAFSDVVDTVVGDQLSAGSVVLPISGGLDSRTLAGVTGTCGDSSELSAYSYGYTSCSDEIKIGAAVARSRRIPHESYVIGPYLPRLIGENLAAVEGFQSVTSTRQTAITRQLAGRSDFVLCGHWGDVWMDELGVTPADEPAHALETMWQKFAKAGRGWLLGAICGRAGGLANPEGLAREMLAQEWARIAAPRVDIRAKAFKTEQWSFRWTVPSIRMFDPGAFALLPFYDGRVVDLCAQFEPGWVTGRRMQIDYLKRRHAGLAQVRWDVTDSSLPMASYYGSLLLPRRILRKLHRIVTGRRHIGRNWEVQLLGDGGRELILRYLGAKSGPIREYVAQGDLDAFVSAFFSDPNPEAGYTMSMLLTFASWIEAN